MVNAQKELIEHIANRPVDFIRLRRGYHSDNKSIIEGTLEEVLPKLDFTYDDGYGGQELYGCIWYADGTWSDRREYDGSEWWEHQVCPDRNTEY